MPYFPIRPLGRDVRSYSTPMGALPVPKISVKLPGQNIAAQSIQAATKRILTKPQVNIPVVPIRPKPPVGSQLPKSAPAYPTGPVVPPVSSQPNPASTQIGPGLFSPVTGPGGSAQGTMVPNGDTYSESTSDTRELLERVARCCESRNYDDDFYFPGVVSDVCTVEPLKGDLNGVMARASMFMKDYSDMDAYDHNAARDMLDRMEGFASWQTGERAAVQALVRWGLTEKAYADFFGLCWTTQAKWWGAPPGSQGQESRAGIYKSGANLCLAGLFGVAMLKQMAFELAAGASQGQGPVWPMGGTATPEAFAAGLALANNIVANYLQIMRGLEANAVRARDTLKICNSRLSTGASSEPGKLSGYAIRRFKGLGAIEPMRARGRGRADAQFFALYYLSRFPALYSLVPENAASMSTVATEMNRRLEELVSYSRGLREEVRLLTLKIQDCERGIAGAPPSVTPPPPSGVPQPMECGQPSSGAVTDLDALPNPYCEHGAVGGAAPASGGTSAGGSASNGSPDGGADGTPPPAPAPVPGMNKGALLVAALGVGIAAARMR